MPSTRLNKFIATTTGVSRREADEVIAAGRVEVITNQPTKNRTGSLRYARDDSANNSRMDSPIESANDRAVATIGQQISADDQVFLDGKLVRNATAPVTIMLNKPVGYLSSRRSQGGNPTVYDLLPAEYKKLKTAGRLDRDSSGLMILSSDGDLIQQLTHPKYAKTKVYEIELDKSLAPLHQQMIGDFGVDLPDGKSRLGLGKSANDNRDRTLWRVTMHEGRNRQIRRTFAALGYDVVKLHRTHLGPYTLGDLPSGKYQKV